MTRLERFRRFVAAMEPNSPTTKAELYVESDPRDAIVDEICTPIELSPNRRILVVGCTGSGKTTLVQRCLRRIQAAVTGTGDQAHYVDVSRVHDLEKELAGVLVAVTGEQLLKLARGHRSPDAEPDAFARARKAILEHSRDTTHWVDDDEPPAPDWDPSDDDVPAGHFVHTRGVLHAPPDPLRPGRFSELVGPLIALKSTVLGDAHLVVAFDSLDRLADPKRFKHAVEHDLRVLAASDVGSIVIGPIRYSLGNDRSILELFDLVKVVPTVDAMRDGGREFLGRVLRVRDEDGIIPDEILPRLAEASGGVLRDLLSLARRAGEEAYSRAHDVVVDDDVDMATSALGDTLAFGVDDAALRVLRRLDEAGEFVIRGESELALVDQRKILNVGPGAWRIHPALLPKLRAIPKEAA